MGSIYASIDFVPSARCSAKTQHPTYSALSCHTISHAFVLMWPSAYLLGSAALFLGMLDYAVAHKDLCPVLAQHVKKLDSWVVEWGCSPDQHVDLYKKALKVLRTVDGNSASSMELLTKLLQIAEESGNAGMVTEEAMLACLTAMKTPETYKCDELLDFASVQQVYIPHNEYSFKSLADKTDLVLQLSGDAKGAKVLELLRIFVSEKVAKYQEFASASANAAFIKEEGLEMCMDKMRLLSVVSLAAEATEKTGAQSEATN